MGALILPISAFKLEELIAAGVQPCFFQGARLVFDYMITSWNLLVEILNPLRLFLDTHIKLEILATPWE